ncbi:MAG: hypothetical protein HQK83_02405 [Fibrobacteria bacterium]|nr:hypothetical protein [Fibrobacteria bacterium]
MKTLIYFLCFLSTIHAGPNHFSDRINFGTTFFIGGHFSEYKNEENRITKEVHLLTELALLPMYFETDIAGGGMTFWLDYMLSENFGIGIHFEKRRVTQSVASPSSIDPEVYIEGNGGGPLINYYKDITQSLSLHINLAGGISKGTIHRLIQLKKEYDRQADRRTESDTTFNKLIYDNSGPKEIFECYSRVNINLGYKFKRLIFSMGPQYRISYSYLQSDNDSDYPNNSYIHNIGIDLCLRVPLNIFFRKNNHEPGGS